MGDNTPLRCRWGWHHFEDFPDPNPETGGLEKRGYRACTRCSKEKDSNIYLSRSGQLWFPKASREEGAKGHPLGRRDQPRQPGDR